MDAEEFRKFGYAAVDFVADYLENIRERFVGFQIQNKLVLTKKRERELNWWLYQRWCILNVILKQNKLKTIIAIIYTSLYHSFVV